MKVLLHVAVVMAANLTAPETSYDWSWVLWGTSPTPPLDPPSPPLDRGVESRPVWERAWQFFQELLPQDDLGAEELATPASHKGILEATVAAPTGFSLCG